MRSNRTRNRKVGRTAVLPARPGTGALLKNKNWRRFRGYVAIDHVHMSDGCAKEKVYDSASPLEELNLQVQASEDISLLSSCWKTKASFRLISRSAKRAPETNMKKNSQVLGLTNIFVL